jgi:tetratricopeptide (TPR) repeat protein
VGAESGLDAHRVAEVIVTGPDGAGRRGSGYRVASDVVLTAAHVVVNARAVHVRFDADTPGEWSVAAVDVVADPASDLAAVVIDAPAAVPTCAFGRVGEGTDELVVQAVGFPRFKLKGYADSAGSYRDSHQAVGTVAPLSNRRSGRLEVTLRPPAHDPDPLASPWEGMSGAALWAGRRIIGVVTDHHRSDGLGRLAAARVTALMDGQRGDAAEWLCRRLGLSADLLDVTAPVRPLAPYLLQVRDIAPEHLRGREEELQELSAFATGTEPYALWEGPPWAGKTALMAWFALHPPPDVDVVPFLVGAGLAGRSDGNAFLDAVTDQLAVLAAQASEAPATSAGLRSGLLALLDAAAQRCREAGRRLVILVDGLDEDTGPATPEPSIAALLPRRPPHGTAVLVTSRPDRALPPDVPPDHPLHRCARRRLPVSPYARDVELFALRELAERLRAGPLHEDLIGLITASGGGLTRDDLAELAGASPFTVADLLSGAFGRSVATRTQRPTAARPGYVLAHRTLREAAELELGPRLEHYRARLHAWCEEHRVRGWPAGTPTYLLYDHPRMLAAAGDAARLTALATDPLRHERLLEATGGDAAALDEIALAQLVGAKRREPDLAAAVQLAVRREELTSRNRHVPVRLPAVWAALGRRKRAAALARGFPKRKKRAAALAAAAVAAAGAGYLDDAEALAGRVPDRDRRDAVLAGMAAAAAVHDPDRAERWARRCTPERRAGALARIATALTGRDPRRAAALVADLAASPVGAHSRVAVATAAVAVGEPDLGEALVAGIARGGPRARASAELGVALADAGEASRAEEIAETIRRPGVRLPVLAALLRNAVTRGDGAAVRRHLATLQDTAGRAAHRGDAVGELLALACAVAGRAPDVAAELLNAGERLVADGVRADRLGWAYARLAVAYAAAGDPERAEVLLDRLTDTDRVAAALTEIAVLAARRGDTERAESMVRRVPGADRRMHALTDLAAGLVPLVPLASAGDHRRAAEIAADAEGMARRTTDPHRLAVMAAHVVDGLVAVGAAPAAREVAERIGDPSTRGTALARVAGALAASGAIDDATALARALDEPERRSWALVSICEAQAATGRKAEAADTAAAVLADPPGDGYTRVIAFLRLSAALRAAGSADEADRLRAAATAQVVEDVSDRGQRARAVAHLSVELDAAGERVKAAVLARRTEAVLAGIRDGQRQDRARTRVVEALAAAGRTVWAEDVSRAIEGPAARIRALAALATATAADPDRAWTLLGRAEQQLDAIETPADRWAAAGRLACAAAVVLAGEGGPADPRRRRVGRLVVELLGSDGWVEAVPALARLDRMAFDALMGWVADRTSAGVGHEEILAET